LPGPIILHRAISSLGMNQNLSSTMKRFMNRFYQPLVPWGRLDIHRRVSQVMLRSEAT
jgi:hypothetical protein